MKVRQACQVSLFQSQRSLPLFGPASLWLSLFLSEIALFLKKKTFFVHENGTVMQFL